MDAARERRSIMANGAYTRQILRTLSGASASDGIQTERDCEWNGYRLTRCYIVTGQVGVSRRPFVFESAFPRAKEFFIFSVAKPRTMVKETKSLVVWVVLVAIYD
jgi:hypothetical protein